MKDCSVCGLNKPYSEFYRNAKGRGGVHHRCKECERARGKGRKRNRSPEADLRHRHKRRGADAPLVVYQLVKLLYPNQCEKCGATDNLHLDHIMPIKLGGTGLWKNLQWLCASCNTSKGATYADYRAIKYSHMKWTPYERTT